MNLITGLEKIYKCKNVNSVLEVYQEIILGIYTQKCQIPDSLPFNEAVHLLMNVVELKITSIIALSLIDEL